MYGGGARNRLHRNAPKVGIYTDVFIAVSEPWPVGGHQVLDGAHLELLYNAGNKFRVEFFVKQGKRNNRKTAKKHLPKRKNEAKSSQGKEAIAVETDREYVIMQGAITPKEKYKKIDVRT